MIRRAAANRAQARPAKVYDGAAPSAPRRVAPSNGTVLRALEALANEAPSTVRQPTRSHPRDEEAAFGRRIRESARGEACTVRLTGVCTHDPATTVWSHGRWGAQLGDAGRGMGTKALDLCGAYACTACDAVFDGQARAPHLTRDEIDLDWLMGHLRSLGRLHEKGLV